MQFSQFLNKQESIYQDFSQFMRRSQKDGYQFLPSNTKVRKGTILLFRFGAEIRKLYDLVGVLLTDTPYKMQDSQIMHSTTTVSKDPVSTTDRTVITDLVSTISAHEVVLLHSSYGNHARL